MSYVSRIFIVHKSTLLCPVQNNIDLLLAEETIQHSSHDRARYALVLNNELLDRGRSLFLQFLRRDAFFVVNWRAEMSSKLYWKAAINRTDRNSRPVVALIKDKKKIFKNLFEKILSSTYSVIKNRRPSPMFRKPSRKFSVNIGMTGAFDSIATFAKPSRCCHKSS